MASEELELSSLKARVPRLALLLARAAARIRAHWFATGATAGMFLGLSAILLLDAGAAGGWWKQLPPFRPPRSAPNLALWIWQNSGYLWERGLFLAVSTTAGGLAALAGGRKFRAWLPARVAEVLDRLWGYEYEFTSAVAAMNGQEITPPAAALGLQIEQRLQKDPPRSLRGVGWGMAGKTPRRLLTAACLTLALSSLASFWLATHTPPSRPGNEESAVAPADSPLHSTFLALQQLADRLEAEARSAEEQFPEQDSSGTDKEIGAETVATENKEKETKSEGQTRGTGDQAKEPSQSGNRPGVRADALQAAAAGLRQAADLLATGGPAALPYTRELVLQAFNDLLQERLNEENEETDAGHNSMPVSGSGSSPGASRLDALLQELGQAARPLLLSPGELSLPAGGPGQDVRPDQGQSPPQGSGREQRHGQGQGQERGEGSKQIAPAGTGTGPATAAQNLPGLYSGAPGEEPDGQRYDGGLATGATAAMGRGSGTNSERLGAPQDLELPATPASPLTGEVGEGPIWVAGSGRPPRAEETGSYALTKQAEVPDSGVEREDLPLAYREWVRRYFGGL